MVEKFPFKTKPAIAKNALDASFLALRAQMQAGEMPQNKSNLALNFQLIPILRPVYYCKDLSELGYYTYKRWRLYLENIVDWEIDLFVVGKTPKSKIAYDNLKGICKTAKVDCKITVIDLLEKPELAAENEIVSTPTTIRRRPLPKVTLVGDLSNSAKAILRLELK